MTTYFQAEYSVVIDIDDLTNKVLRENYTLVSFVREPLDRFYSSFDEALLRWGPWIGDRDHAERMPRAAEYYAENRHRLDKFPYLYEGIRTYEDYSRLFCRPGGGRTGKAPNDDVRRRRRAAAPAAAAEESACDEVRNASAGLALTERFERFVRDYDGADPFDAHLECQVPYLVDGRDGTPLPVSALYNASEADGGWRDIARAMGAEIPEGGLRVVRSAPRNFDLSKVTDYAKQKICRILALDYCCLNFELPEVCRMSEGEGVYCAVRRGRSGRNEIIHTAAVGHFL
jgi:hypothetical protein